MTGYRLVAEPAVDADVEAVFGWYENEDPGLGASCASGSGRLAEEGRLAPIQLTGHRRQRIGGTLGGAESLGGLGGHPACAPEGSGLAIDDRP